MKRYIVSNGALKHVARGNKGVQFKHLGVASIVLTDKQVKLLEKNGFKPKPEVSEKVIINGGDYEKIRTKYSVAQSRRIDGKGCKVAVIDSGCNSPVLEYVDFPVNFADVYPGITDNLGHGTRVTSTIKSSIGIANGCKLHCLKVIQDNGTVTWTSLLAAVNYCIGQKIDILNLSFSYGLFEFNEALTKLMAAGCIVAAGSGNSKTDANIPYPASLAGVIAVNTIAEDGSAFYKNYLGGHGIDFACSGVGCEGINSVGVLSLGWGTSYAVPFFVGTFAYYKQFFGIPNNNYIIHLMRKRAIKVTPSKYFGYGIPKFNINKTEILI